MITKQPHFISMDSRIKLYHGNSHELISELEDASIKAILTDPPYGINWKSNWVPKHEQKEILAGDKDLSWMGDFLIECERLLEPNGSLYISARRDKVAVDVVRGRILWRTGVPDCIVWDRI